MAMAASRACFGSMPVFSDPLFVILQKKRSVSLGVGKGMDGCVCVPVWSWVAGSGMLSPWIP